MDFPRPVLAAALAATAWLPSGACAAPPPARGDRLVERIELARGLTAETWTHVKTARDFSRLENLVRSYAPAIRVRLLRVDPRRFALRVLDAAAWGGAPRGTARDVVARSGALAAVNAGFFDQADRPVGLHVAGGRTLQPFGMAAKRTAGVFYELGGRYAIVTNSCWRRFHVLATPPPPVREAVQCFPLLVAGGRVAFAQGGGGVAARTAVGLTARGEVVLAVTENDPLNGVLLPDMAAFLAGPVACRLALNLDGGPSSQLYARAAGREVSEDGRDAVRTFLAVVPRPDAP